MPASTLVRLEGFHAVKHALRFAPALVGEVRVADIAGLQALALRLAPDVLAPMLDRAVLAPVRHHTGVEADAVRPVIDHAVLASRLGPLVLLDRPRHPGNVGAVVRVCAAAGAAGVAVTGPLDPWAPAVLRGAAGLHFALPVLSVDPLAVDGRVDAAWPVGVGPAGVGPVGVGPVGVGPAGVGPAGVGPAGVAGPVVVLDAGGDPAGVLPRDCVLVVGGERDGVGEEWRERADGVLALPMRPGVSSLNLATAVAAALYRR